MSTSKHAPWYRLLSLRSRMILVTAAIVAVVLAVGGVVILLAVEAELVDAADEVGEVHAAEVAALAAAGDLPRPLPVSLDPEVAVQVLSKGRVLTQSTNIVGTRAFDLTMKPGPGDSEIQEVDGLRVAEDGPYRVTARGIATPDGAAIVYVAIPMEDIEDTMATATEVLVAGLAVLVLVLSGVMWLIIGRTLAPVERIRQQASAITGRHLHRRVVEPAQRDEIGRLARTVNEMLARLEDSADRQNSFVADAAHELRSPIASLRTQLETARIEQNGDGLSVPDLLQETYRMQTLVDRLLLLAHTDSGDLAMQRVTVDLDDTVDDVMSSLVDARVSVDLSDVHPAQMNGDPDLLEQVVRNIVQNAMRYAVRDVKVSLRTEDQRAVLTIDDDGPGIPVERRGDIFRRFTRLDAARDRREGGVGLGLAIVAEIVRAHGGQIDVGCAPIGGARLQVRLPLVAHYPSDPDVQQSGRH
ncbi:MAG: HAMP domain-containing sensor histidine kinase [Nocardioidaceae bacterium]